MKIKNNMFLFQLNGFDDTLWSPRKYILNFYCKKRTRIERERASAFMRMKKSALVEFVLISHEDKNKTFFFYLFLPHPSI